MISRIIDKSFNVVFEACTETLLALGTKIDYASKKKGTIVASYGFSLLSWGEEIQIILNKKTDRKTEIIIESNSDNQMIDWGKNSNNEQEFDNKLFKLLGRK